MNHSRKIRRKRCRKGKEYYKKNETICHDLKEILWVPNFLLYLSNMLSTIGVKELRFYT